MAVDRPAWLNVELIQTILRKSKNDETIEVKDINTKLATAKGDNYVSDMIRVCVKYSHAKAARRMEKEKSLVIKVSPTVTGVLKDLVEELGIFETEIAMIDTKLEKMNSMLNENEGRFNARALYTRVGDPSMLVFEDLASMGFRMADRQAGLDFQHSLLAIRGLAKFHGTSVAFLEREPKEMLSEKHLGTFHHKRTENYKKYFYEGMKMLAKEVANWNELGPGYVEKFEKLSIVGYEKAADCAARKDDEFNVINHGDCWVNNMLFRYDDEGNVVGHIFVDFQLCVYTSPAIDIQYFLNTSISDEVYTNHRDTLVEEYHDTLSKMMIKLGCRKKAPSIATLKKSLEEREFYGVFSACTILPTFLNDKSEAKDINDLILEDGTYDNPAFKGKQYREIMLKRLPEWNLRGLLDA